MNDGITVNGSGIFVILDFTTSLHVSFRSENRELLLGTVRQFNNPEQTARSLLVW